MARTVTSIRAIIVAAIEMVIQYRRSKQPLVQALAGERQSLKWWRQERGQPGDAGGSMFAGRIKKQMAKTVTSIRSIINRSCARPCNTTRRMVGDAKHLRLGVRLVPSTHKTKDRDAVSAIRGPGRRPHDAQLPRRLMALGLAVVLERVQSVLVIGGAKAECARSCLESVRR